MTEALRAKVFSSLGWAAVRVWGNRLSGFLIFLVLARVLSPAEFGIYGAVWAVLLFLEVFAEQGLSDAVIQKREVGQRLLNTVFVVNLAFSAAIAVAVVVLAPRVGEWMDMPAMVLPLQVSAVSLILNGLGFCQFAMHRRAFNYRLLAARTLISTLVSGALGVVLALSGFGVWSLIAQYVTNSALNLVLLWIRPTWRPSLAFTGEGIVQLMRYSLNLFGARLLDAVNTRGFELVLGAWQGAVGLGIFVVASRVQGILMQMLSSVVLDVAHTALSRLADRRESFVEAYYRSQAANAAVAFPCFLLLSALATPICVAVFGARWTSSGEILAMLGMLSAVQTLQYFNSVALNAVGHPLATLCIALFKSAATVGAIVLYRDATLAQIVLAYCVAQACALPVSFALGRRFIGFRWRELAAWLLPFVVAGGALYASARAASSWAGDANPWLAIVAGATAGIGVYVLVILLLARDRLRAAIASVRRNEGGSTP